MRFKIVTALVMAGALLAGCGSSSSSSSTKNKNSSTKTNKTTTKKATTKPKPKNDAYQELRDAVQAYSDAYLTGDATTAYNLLSDRCRKRTAQEEFTKLSTAAADLYNSKLQFKTYTATISGDTGRASYTYTKKELDQANEPWIREAGNWHQDDC